MTQLSLFPVSRRRKREVMPLVCSFSVPWLDHFAAPIGTGLGCVPCREYRP